MTSQSTGVQGHSEVDNGDHRMMQSLNGLAWKGP